MAAVYRPVHGAWQLSSRTSPPRHFPHLRPVPRQSAPTSASLRPPSQREIVRRLPDTISHTPPCPRQQRRTRQPLRPFAVFAQRPQAHDPCVRPLVHRALVADDQELLTRMEPLDPRKPARGLRGLQREETQFHEGGWRSSQRRQLAAERALGVVEDVERFHGVTPWERRPRDPAEGRAAARRAASRGGASWRTPPG